MTSCFTSLSGAGKRASSAALLGVVLMLAGCAHQTAERASQAGGGTAERTSDTSPQSAIAGDSGASRALDAMSDGPLPALPGDDGASSSMTACACGKTFEQTGMASWYGKMFHGRRTASGERYDMQALTAAHRTLPLGACVRVTTLGSARSVIVRINDRGPFVRGRVIDLSYAAARALGVVSAGAAQVKLERVATERQAPAGRGCSKPGL